MLYPAELRAHAALSYPQPSALAIEPLPLRSKSGQQLHCKEHEKANQRRRRDRARKQSLFGGVGGKLNVRDVSGRIGHVCFSGLLPLLNRPSRQTNVYRFGLTDLKQGEGGVFMRVTKTPALRPGAAMALARQRERQRCSRH